jgi:multidrug resistance efflux pump
MIDIHAELIDAQTRLNEARAKVVECRANWQRVRDRVDNLPVLTGVEDIPGQAAYWLAEMESELAKLDSSQATLVRIERLLQQKAN